MPLSVVDLYRDVLPKTNCKQCGFPTCMAFASMVVSEKHPLENCPHLSPDVVAKCRIELEQQYAEGKWLKRDMAQDALQWAKKRAASMEIKDLPERIGGTFTDGARTTVELPYFNDAVLITSDGLHKKSGAELTRWEQVFIYNHMAQGGRVCPIGKWKGLVEFPNTVSKMKSMLDHVEVPLIKAFRGKRHTLLSVAKRIGGVDQTDRYKSADCVIYFQPLPRVPVMLLFWDGDAREGFETEVKLMFDETILAHLDIESIMFLSERLRELLVAGIDDEPV